MNARQKARLKKDAAQLRRTLDRLEATRQAVTIDDDETIDILADVAAKVEDAMTALQDLTR